MKKIQESGHRSLDYAKGEARELIRECAAAAQVEFDKSEEDQILTEHLGAIESGGTFSFNGNAIRSAVTEAAKQAWAEHRENRAQVLEAQLARTFGRTSRPEADPTHRAFLQAGFTKEAADRGVHRMRSGRYFNFADAASSLMLCESHRGVTRESINRVQRRLNESA